MRSASVFRDGPLVFEVTKHGPFRLGVAETNGTAARYLTPKGLGSEMEPAWSPKGRWVVEVGDGAGQPDIYLVSADGTTRKRITWTRDVAESDPGWSPDGKHIVYAASKGSGPRDLFVRNLDGTGRHQITYAPADDRYPSWSARGIAFTSNRSGRYEVYVMNPDGTHIRQLTSVTTTGTKHGGTDPSWSPDGSRIAFASDRGDPGYTSIWLMNADGSKQRELVGFGAPCSVSAPAWSPSGGQIAYSSCIWLRVVNTVGPAVSRPIRLGALGGTFGHPSWQPLPG